MSRAFITQSPIASSLNAVHRALDLAWENLPCLCYYDYGFPCRGPSFANVFVITITDSHAEGLHYPVTHRFLNAVHRALDLAWE